MKKKLQFDILFEEFDDRVILESFISKLFDTIEKLELVFKDVANTIARKVKPQDSEELRKKYIGIFRSMQMEEQEDAEKQKKRDIAHKLKQYDKYQPQIIKYVDDTATKIDNMLNSATDKVSDTTAKIVFSAKPSKTLKHDLIKQILTSKKGNITDKLAALYLILLKKSLKF